MKKIILGLIVIGLSFTGFVYYAEIMASLMAFEKQSMEMPIVASFILIGLKTISAVLGLPGTPLTLLSGSLFGKFLGTIIALIGNTLGAAAAFLLSRYVFRDYVEKNILPKYPKMKEYDEKLQRKGFSTVVALRLIPLFPFNALNFLFGVTSVPFKKYVLGSFIGMIPGTFIFVYFGQSLRMLSVLNITLAVLGIVVLTYLGRKYEKHFSS
jgi:uncharacterized membrane protein YdjX (TVP38/TMEM64 family)